MARFVITLLVGLPLLMPPGVCICDWLARCEACDAQAAVAEPEEAACSCCRHEPSISLTHSCQPTERDDHVPACPLKDAGTPQWKADTVQPATPIAALAMLGLIGSVTEIAPCSILAGMPHSFHGDRPIYLTLLTLRI